MTRYNWSEVEQIYLICAYYIGYTITNLLGGILAERFGATKTISVILAVTAASFATIPKVASLGYGPLFALRVLQGSIEVPTRWPTEYSQDSCPAQTISDNPVNKYPNKYFRVLFIRPFSTSSHSGRLRVKRDDS